MNEHHNEIKDTIEQIRKEKYPSINKEIVERILEIEINNQENRAEANKQISALLNKIG